MTPLQSIPADLVTPLGAYLRLRDERGGSFLLESVERGRLGRNSFVGWGSRVVSFAEAEAADAPVVGYLSYDYAATLEPTVPLPAEGPQLPESRFVVVESLIRFDHAASVAEVLVGDSRRHRGPARGAVRGHADTDAERRDELRRSPTQARYEEMVRRCKDVHRGGRRVPGRAVAARRAQTPAAPLDLYRALRRVNPSPYLFLLELDELALVGSSPERLVACESGHATRQPDRRHDGAERGRRREAARVREGSRRARDARRSRAQRPLPSLSRRNGARRPLDGGRAVLARLAPRLRGGRRPA